MSINFENFDQLQNPIIVVDTAGKILYYNHICSSYFKLPPRKLNKFELVESLLIIKNSSISLFLKNCLKNNTPVITEEVEISLPEDEHVKNTVILKFIPIGKNILIHLIDFTIERQLHQKYKDQIEKLKNTHAQIVLSDKLSALGEMTAGISHEISTPLVVINDRLDSLESSLENADIKAIGKKVAELKSAFNRVSKIISNMQTFVRNQEDQFCILELNKVVENARNFILDLNSSKNINFLLKADSSPLILGNEGKIQQILINLIKNSIDALLSANTKDPTIEIIIENNRSDKLINIIVQDNGPGISKQNSEKLFEMFFTTKDMGDGTGLGLSISKKIAEAHQGQLTFDETYKAGARFKFELPSIELATFCHTNHYLQGETSSEGKKVFVIGSDIKLLNNIYLKLSKLESVTIVSNNINEFSEQVSFYNSDFVIAAGDVKLAETEVEILKMKIFDENIIDNLSKKLRD